MSHVFLAKFEWLVSVLSINRAQYFYVFILFILYLLFILYYIYIFIFIYILAFIGDVAMVLQKNGSRLALNWFS